MPKSKREIIIPPFDRNCKNCGRPIPSPLDFCGSRCKREYVEKQDIKEEIETEHESKKKSEYQATLS